MSQNRKTVLKYHHFAQPMISFNLHQPNHVSGGNWKSRGCFYRRILQTSRFPGAFAALAAASGLKIGRFSGSCSCKTSGKTTLLKISVDNSDILAKHQGKWRSQQKLAVLAYNKPTSSIHFHCCISLPELTGDRDWTGKPDLICGWESAESPVFSHNTYIQKELCWGAVWRFTYLKLEAEMYYTIMYCTILYYRL